MSEISCALRRPLSPRLNRQNSKELSPAYEEARPSAVEGARGKNTLLEHLARKKEGVFRAEAGAAGARAPLSRRQCSGGHYSILWFSSFLPGRASRSLGRERDADGMWTPYGPRSLHPRGAPPFSPPPLSARRFSSIAPGYLALIASPAGPLVHRESVDALGLLVAGPSGKRD